jgi:rubrerythrin
MKMASEITDTKARSVFQSLIEEEKVHLAKLGKLLGSTIKREAKR